MHTACCTFRGIGHLSNLFGVIQRAFLMYQLQQVLQASCTEQGRPKALRVDMVVRCSAIPGNTIAPLSSVAVRGAAARIRGRMPGNN